jgi:hypothetical protein
MSKQYITKLDFSSKAFVADSMFSWTADTAAPQ